MTVEPHQSASLSTSPSQTVLDRDSDHCGHCTLCDAYGDTAPEDVAWLWVEDHRCGVESRRVQVDL